MPIASDVVMGRNVRIPYPDLVNLYGCRLGDDVFVGPFVEIQRGCSVGSRCKISSHSFLCGGVTIEDEVMIAHGVMFTNDRHPRATTDDGRIAGSDDWTLVPTRVCQGASIGSNATVLPGVIVGRRALVGAGAVVSRDVPDHAIAIGVPARVIGCVGHDRQTTTVEAPQS